MSVNLPVERMLAGTNDFREALEDAYEVVPSEARATPETKTTTSNDTADLRARPKPR
jgi:hypothetical protein